MYQKFFKRILDVILSLIALIILSPLLIILTFVGAIQMCGNPFFLQDRPGKDEKIFKLIKFRTMTNEKDKDGNLLPDEKRLNKYGEFLRKTSFDEWPELINILKGDMSIVGPRPQLVKDMIFMTPEQRRRHTVMPGLTGLAQVNGRNSISWEKKINWDLKYIDQGISFWHDFSIVIKTVGKVLKHSDIVREGTVSDLDLGEYLVKENKITTDEYISKISMLTK